MSQLEASGVSFIGPSPAAITGMGDKLQSKRLAIKAKVNTIPGRLGGREMRDCSTNIVVYKDHLVLKIVNMYRWCQSFTNI